MPRKSFINVADCLSGYSNYVRLSYKRPDSLYNPNHFSSGLLLQIVKCGYLSTSQDHSVVRYIGNGASIMGPIRWNNPDHKMDVYPTNDSLSQNHLFIQFITTSQERIFSEWVYYLQKNKPKKSKQVSRTISSNFLIYVKENEFKVCALDCSCNIYKDI